MKKVKRKDPDSRDPNTSLKKRGRPRKSKERGGQINPTMDWKVRSHVSSLISNVDQSRCLYDNCNRRVANVSESN